MSDTVAPPGRPSAAWLFVLAVFVSAALVFTVEPMMAKLVLPVLGGSAAFDLKKKDDATWPALLEGRLRAATAAATGKPGW